MGHKIIYLSYGGQRYHEQTRFSVLTLLDLLLKNGRRDVRIVIFTDQPEESPAHDLVSSIYIAPDELTRMRGPLDFVHRIKLEVMRRAEVELGLPFIFVDSDTRWLKFPDTPLASLADASQPRTGRPTGYMHKLEGPISPTFLPQHWRLLHQTKKQLEAWRMATDGWILWNAGTLGVPVQARGLFDRALAINDELLPHSSYRNGVEQLTLSLIAASEFELRPFEEYLAHYWYHGSELPVVVRRFFQELPPGLSVEEQAKRAGNFPIEDAELKAIQRAQAGLLRKWRRKLRTSLYKRKIDIKAFWLRRQRASKAR